MTKLASQIQSHAYDRDLIIKNFNKRSTLLGMRWLVRLSEILAPRIGNLGNM